MSMFKGFADVDANVKEEFIDNYNESKKAKRVRRKTISDKLITDDIIDKLALKCATLNTRREIVEKLLTLELSNAVIAKIINKTIPYSNATANRIASVVNAIRKDRKLIDELLQDIGEL